MIDNLTQSEYCTNSTCRDAIMNDCEAKLSVLMYYAVPTVAFFGVSGNLVSIRILVHHGLSTSFNVMLLALACADSSFLIAMFLYGVTATTGCQYLRQSDSFFYIFYKFLQIMDNGGCWFSFMLTILVTAERVVIVYFPLQASQWVSVKKTIVAILCLFTICFTWAIILMVATLEKPLKYSYYTCVDTTAKCPIQAQHLCAVNLAWSRNIVDSSDLTAQVPLTSYMFYGPFPVSLSVIGCLAIVVKMIQLKSKRQEMTHREESIIKPTLSILVVCLVYATCSTVIFMIHSKSITGFYEDCGECKLKLDVLSMEVVNAIATFNCSVNFLIYVVTNHTYRRSFVELCVPSYFWSTSASQTPAIPPANTTLNGDAKTASASALDGTSTFYAVDPTSTFHLDLSELTLALDRPYTLSVDRTSFAYSVDSPSISSQKSKPLDLT